MRKQVVSSMGMELNWNVPESASEYNSLAPKRADAVLEDAINSTWYRSGANKLRDQFCEWLEKNTGVARVNNGTEDDPKWEQEGKYIKRVIVAVAEQRGLDVNAKSTRDALLAEWTPAAQGLLDAIKFDPSEREATGGQPQLAKTYINWATQAVKTGKGQALADMLAKLNNTTITLSGNEEADVTTLAKAIAANEKRKRDEQLAAAKAEYGLSQ